VRTNTGTAPDRRDQFVVVAGGKWSPTPPALEDEILRACGYRDL